MKDSHDRAWEEKFRQQEIDIRLRQLAAEIDRVDPPIFPTAKESIADPLVPSPKICD